MDNNEKKGLINAWINSAHEDLKTSEGLFYLKRFSGCLFFCHLTVEKLLKAVYIKKKDTYPPYAHKLAKLAKDASVKLTQKQTEELVEITTFNIEARYDIFKQKLYKKATKAYAQKYLKITQELLTFFTSLL